MTKDTFRIGIDDTGRQYVYQFIDEQDKNHMTDTGGSVTEGRMYELSGIVLKFISNFNRQYVFCVNSLFKKNCTYLTGNSICPVLSFQKYISKLNPDRHDFWQRPRDVFNQEDGVWYLNSAVGKIHYLTS